jgi:hypothetical protein
VIKLAQKDLHQHQRQWLNFNILLLKSNLRHQVELQRMHLVHVAQAKNTKDVTDRFKATLIQYKPIFYRRF